MLHDCRIASISSWKLSSVENTLQGSQIIVTCRPHGHNTVSQTQDSELRFIDFTIDYRLSIIEISIIGYRLSIVDSQ